MNLFIEYLSKKRRSLRSDAARALEKLGDKKDGVTAPNLRTITAGNDTKTLRLPGGKTHNLVSHLSQKPITGQYGDGYRVPAVQMRFFNPPLSYLWPF